MWKHGNRLLLRGKKNDFSKMTASTNYPDGLNKYICESFIRLKAKQAEMLGFSDIQPSPPNCNQLGEFVGGANKSDAG